MARPFNTKPQSYRYGTNRRECACGRTISAGSAWTQHERACEKAQQAKAEREAARLLRDLRGA